MEITVASSALDRLRGLFGRRETVDVLLLVPCNDIHTFGMRRAIDVAFITHDGEVLESYRNVGMCRRLRCRQAAATLERFSRSSPWFKPGDRVNLIECARGILEE